jgi:FKBP-type peptidyl-prolyl cis-trans isomerase
MIPGFIEGLEKLAMEKKLLFIPSHLAYGRQLQRCYSTKY